MKFSLIFITFLFAQTTVWSQQVPIVSVEVAIQFCIETSENDAEYNQMLKSLSKNRQEFKKILSMRNTCRKVIREMPQKVLPFLLSALENAEQKEESKKSYVANILVRIASTYQALGDETLAERYFIEAADLSAQCYGKYHYSHLNYCTDLSRFYQVTGQYEKALAYQNIVLNNWKYTIDSNNYYYHMAHKGNSLRLLGKLGEAQSVLEEVHKFHNQKNKIENYANIQLAFLYFELGAFEKACDLNKKLIGRYNVHWNKDQEIQFFAQIYDALNQTEKSANYWLQYGTILLERANIFAHLSESNQIKFLQTFQQGFSEIQSFALRNPEYSSITSLCYNQQLKMKELILGNRKLFLENLKAGFDENLKTKYIEWESLQTILAKEYSLPVKKRSPDFEQIVQQAIHLENELANASAEFRNSIQNVHWEDVQSRLKLGELAIEFGHFDYYETGSLKPSGKSLYSAYIIDNKCKAPQPVPLFEEKELGNIKRTQFLYSFSNPQNKANLHQLIYQKLAEHLDGVQSIYFSPTGKMHRLNMGAIPVNATQTMAENFQLFQLGSTRNLVNQASNANTASQEALIFGGIQYDLEYTETPKLVSENPTDFASTDFAYSISRDLRGKEWNYLEWTQKEAEVIHEILQNSNIEANLKNKLSASEEAFKDIGAKHPSPQILHLATHGYFFPKPKKEASTGFQSSGHPLIRSGLILAGANHVWKGGDLIEGKEDGILTAYEIAQMDLTNTEIVVLSACKTGLGDIESSEGIFGLQRAFKMAGANYILMSLWSVDDKKTYEFMAIFYTNWQEHKQTIPKAYQNAQNEMKEKYADLGSPQAWAGFVLVE